MEFLTLLRRKPKCYAILDQQRGKWIKFVGWQQPELPQGFIVVGQFTCEDECEEFCDHANLQHELYYKKEWFT